MHVIHQWSNKHLLPPHIDDKRGEPEMTPCLAVLVKQVIELHDAGLWACHYAEEFTLQLIHPLNRREKLANECPRFVDPSCDPTDSMFLISFIAAADLICFLSYVVFADDEVFRLVSRMFDKSLVPALPATVPEPYYSEDPPP
jgi:hypothetical protein